MMPQRAYVDFPRQIVSTLRGMRKYSMVRASAKLLGGMMQHSSLKSANPRAGAAPHAWRSVVGALPMKFTIALVAAVAAALPPAAWPQVIPADLSQAPQDPCRVEVSKFEQAIGFVRQNQGNQAAQD